MTLQENDKIFTENIVKKAYKDVLSKEMDYFDAIYTDPFIDKYYEELIKNKAVNGEFNVEYAKEIIDDYKYNIPERVLEAYGWTSYDVKQAITKYLPEEYKNFLVDENDNEEEGEM